MYAIALLQMVSIKLSRLRQNNLILLRLKLSLPDEVRCLNLTSIKPNNTYKENSSNNEDEDCNPIFLVDVRQ